MKKLSIVMLMLLTFLTACSKHKITESLENLNISPGVKYTVTFNSMDGTSVPALSVESGDFVKEPTAPSKEGFTFVGWYKEPSLTNQWNFATDKVTEEVRLYAKWSPQKYSLIQGGTFVMGNTTNVSGDTDEIPHNVTLSSYYMGKTEVTFDEFDAYTTEKGLPQKNSNDWLGADMGRGTRPVINVTWWDVIKYANWLSEKEGFPKAYNENTGELVDDKGQVTTDTTKVKGYRLPTEAEWEYAARERGKDIVYAWGNGNPMVNGKPTANIADETYKAIYSESNIWNAYTDIYSGTAPVGSFVANELGLYDMTGNVFEWCHDYYGAYVSNGSNPIGAVNGSDRVLRGGGWYSDSTVLRIARRNVNSPIISYEDLGFRLVRSSN